MGFFTNTKKFEEQCEAERTSSPNLFFFYLMIISKLNYNHGLSLSLLISYIITIHEERIAIELIKHNFIHNVF